MESKPRNYYANIIKLGYLCFILGICTWFLTLYDITRTEFPRGSQGIAYELKIKFTYTVNPYFWGGIWVGICL